MTLGEDLKSPGEVIQECYDFHDAKVKRCKIEDMREDGSIYKSTVLDSPQDKLADLKKLEKLVPEISFAYMLCDVYLNDHPVQFSDGTIYYPGLGDFITNFTRWERDPSRSGQFKGSDEEYMDMLDKERQKIIEDCKNCKEYKEKLFNRFRWLECTYMYHKLNEKAYIEEADKLEQFQKSWFGYKN